MTDAWQSIRISEFEHVTAGPSTSLLRVSGKPRWRRSAQESPVLLVMAGKTPLRFAALPAAEEARGQLRATYSVPTQLVSGATRFSLEHLDGSLTELPQPTPGAVRAGDDQLAAGLTGPGPDSAAGEPSPVGAPLPSPGPPRGMERRSDLLSKLTEQSGALAHAERVAAERSRALDLAESALERLRGQVSALERQLADAEALGGQSEQRAVDAEVGLTKAEQHTADAEGRIRAAVSEAAAAREHAETLEQLRTELELALTEGQERIGALKQEIEALAPSETLQREVEVLRSNRISLEHELDQARDQLRTMTFERDELNRQASAFDAIAVKARERAAQVEAANQELNATLQELETWRGELERRLTATTSELGAAKTAREAERAEMIRRAEQLLEFARAPDPAGSGGDAKSAELITAD